MKLAYFTNAVLIGLASAFNHPEPKGHEFRRPKAGEVRSPCPGLNVLANHGWLPRSGKEIDYDAISRATEGAYHYAPGTFDFAVDPVFQANLSSTETYTKTFNLDDLGSPKAHGTVEFDGSLSRKDFLLGGDALHFDPKVWEPVAQHLGLARHSAKFRKEKYITVEVAAKARAARQKIAMEANPQFNASEFQKQGSIGTTALYLTTLWDDKADAAPKAWVKAFFEEERLAYKEGFKRPEKVKTGETLGKMNEAVKAVPVSC
ncbi:hypothetical protein FQN50_004610 [Emmonsiellopsis sp. PD_5]|nr:hypothetical protein FQN50_004610 [Emmonsiellopsis sp. PD_5]